MHVLNDKLNSPEILYFYNIYKEKISSPLINGCDSFVNTGDDLTMEAADMGWGSMVYTNTLPAIEKPSTL